MPGYKNYTEFDFGFKIRDKERPQDWWTVDGVMMLPPEDSIPKGVVEGAKSAFGTLFGGEKA